MGWVGYQASHVFYCTYYVRSGQDRIQEFWGLIQFTAYFTKVQADMKLNDEKNHYKFPSVSSTTATER